MGTKQSSLANSASNQEENHKLEVKLYGERGRSVNQENQDIVEVVSDDFGTDSDWDLDSDESDDEEEDEDFAERLRILDDAKKLKALAVAFLHPELPVKVDPTAFARCYFDRASAPEQEDLEEAEYRRQVLADAAALKKLAVDYAHPELGVVTSDSTATARCYFDRASAPQREEAKVPVSKPAETQAPVVVQKSVDAKTTVKTVDTSKGAADIVRSLSSVKLFGLDGEGDASY